MPLSIQDVYAGFRSRLAAILKREGLDATKLAVGLTEAGHDVTDSATRKWLREGTIGEKQLIALAEYLNEDPGHLRYGTGGSESKKDSSLLETSSLAVARRALIADAIGVQGRLSMVCRILDAAVWEYNLLSNKLMLDGQVDAIYGAPLSELSITSPDSLLHNIHPDDRAKFSAAWTDALDGKASEEMRIRIRWSDYGDGHTVSAWVAPQYNSNDHLTAVIGIFVKHRNNKQ